MQGQLVQRFVQEKLIETHDILLKDDRRTENRVSTDVFGDVAELVAGYMDCIEEVLLYLKDVERYPDDHPAIVNLREHLVTRRTQFLCQTIENSSEEVSIDFSPSSSPHPRFCLSRDFEVDDMIPSLPEAISATHVEYLPLPTIHLKPFIDLCRNDDGRTATDAAELRGRKMVTKEELARIRTLRAQQQFVPLNLSALPTTSLNVNLFRGNDLYYAPHVNVPAAESLENS